jgi:glycosyltransferase involved in cell wall biosynthesis
VQDGVHLCGFQRNPWQFMAQADVFALSSHYEGFGNVVVEAMACGVPVVATSSPGTRDIVSDGVDGFLVDSHEPDPFAAALAKLVTDGALRARLSAAALAKARRYDTATVAACYDRVLAGVLA